MVEVGEARVSKEDQSLFLGILKLEKDLRRQENGTANDAVAEVLGREFADKLRFLLLQAEDAINLAVLNMLITASTPVLVPLKSLKKFDFVNVKTASTPIETQKPLVKDEEEVMSSKTSHLSAVKRIFRYLKGKPKLGLWYPRVSSFDLEAYSDSDYAGANLDRNYLNRSVVNYLARRLIS
ncbi:hypothetical protein Tco_0657001 [Tanacetum coccineum]|uniref:Uncharacterized protein n=1 Tax=Tanacetum coccineum TaxID=301880 RepID=A0ABQ4XBM5_9ASTR